MIELRKIFQNFKFFILIEIFGNSSIFQLFHTSIKSIGTLKLFRLNFKGKTVVKFLIRSHFLSIQIKQYDKKKINSDGSIQNAFHLHNGIFHPIHLSHFFNFITSPELFDKNNKLRNKRRHDFFYISLFQHITLYQSRKKVASFDTTVYLDT